MGVKGEIIMGFSPEVKLAQFLSLCQVVETGFKPVSTKAGVFIAGVSALKCGVNGCPGANSRGVL